MLIFNCFNLGVQSNGFGLEANYMIIKDYCKKYNLDGIEVFRVIKSMVGEYGSD